MNFTKALAAQTKEERERLFTECLNDLEWGDYLESGCRRGGYPDDWTVNEPTFNYDRNDCILTQVEIEFLENVSTSCASCRDCSSKLIAAAEACSTSAAFCCVMPSI